jgi:hypothetical protein
MKTTTLLFSAGLALAGCRGGDRVLEPHGKDSTGIVGIERLDGSGPYQSGQTERFRVQHALASPAQVTWTASAGTITSDGDVATWRLPDQDEATLHLEVAGGGSLAKADYAFRLARTRAGPGGVIDTAPDSVSDSCVLRFAGATPHIAYFKRVHPSLWHAVWNGSAWVTEQVDGMGFNVGGQVDDNYDMTLDAAGNPHFAYVLSNSSEIWWASKSGGTWTRQKVDAFMGGVVGIALDPSQASRPTIAYTAPASTGSGYQVKVGYRASGSWTTALTTFPTEGSSTYPYYGRYFAGGFAFDSTGKAFLSYGDDYYNDISLGTWTAAGAQTGQSVSPRASGQTYSGWPVALDSANRPLLLSQRALFQVTPGGSSAPSSYEAGYVAAKAMTYYGGKPTIALVHGSHLEMVTPDANGYWTYTQLGSSDSSVSVSAATDGSGVAHACWPNSSQIQYQ